MTERPHHRPMTPGDRFFADIEAGQDPAVVAEAAERAGAVAGVADPPGPDELKTMIDQVLRGIAGSDFADVLFRAAAFARLSSISSPRASIWAER